MFKISKRGLVAASLSALALTAALTGCASTAAEKPAGDTASKTVTLGVVGASDAYWEVFVDAAAAEGIKVELVDFADYNQPNPAVSENEVDLNQFQHIVYLADYNVNNDDTLVPIGATAIYPLAVFSSKFKSVDEIPEGGVVAIPQDESNRARALLVLQSAGLLTLKDGGTIFSTPDDIDASKSKVTVQEFDASIVATSLPDVDAGVINNDFVIKSGLEFKDALATDDPEDPNALPYVNIFATRAADADNPTYLKLVEIYQTNPEVQAGVLEVSGGTAVLLQTPVKDLKASLTKVEADTKAQQGK